MDMDGFRPVTASYTQILAKILWVVSSGDGWFRVIADVFGLTVLVGCGWFSVHADDFGWFQVVFGDF